MGALRNFRVWRGDADGGQLEDFKVEVNEGEVVLDVIHRLQATQTPDLAVRWNCKAGKCGSCSMEINGKPRLGCMTRMSTFDAAETVTDHSTADIPGDPRSGHRRVVQLPEGARDAGLRAAARRGARASTGCSRSTSTARRSSASASSASCARTPATWCVTTRTTSRPSPGPRFFIRAAELDMHPLDARTDRKDFAQEEQGLGCCNITKCCTEVCPEHIKITDNAIIPMKERVVDNRYDPLVWLGRKIFRRDQLAAQAVPQPRRRGPRAPPRRPRTARCGTWHARPHGRGGRAGRPDGGLRGRLRPAGGGVSVRRGGHVPAADHRAELPAPRRATRPTSLSPLVAAATGHADASS